MTAKPMQTIDFPGLWVNAQPIVRSLILGAIRNLHDAEDILQEVARSAYTSFHRYDPSQPFNTWVMSIARRRIVDHLRSRKAPIAALDEKAIDSLIHAHEKLNDIALARRAALGQCIEELHDRGRTVLTRRYVDNHPVKDIAAELDTSAHAISVLLYKVKSRLAQCIKGKLVTTAEDAR